MEKNFPRPQLSLQKSNFDLYKDKDKLKESFERFGFSGIKIWEQQMNFMFKTGEEYMEKMGNSRLTRQLNEVNKNTPEIFSDMSK